MSNRSYCMQSFLTRFHPKYLRSLVYMAQASEYRARDFVRWFSRTSNFSRVEQRKSLVKTPKALLMLAILYVSTALIYVFALWVILVGSVWWRLIAALIMALGAPYALAYGLAGLLFVWDFLQWPIESAISAHARKRLAGHKALKIAIAGSYGKTSMRETVKAVLSAGRRVSAPPGSYNTPLGINSFIRGLKGDEEVLIFELGEYYPGDVRRLCKLVQPDIGIITGVNEAHLEKFKDLERTTKTIFELADYLGDKPLYINGESPLAKGVPARAGVVYYTRSGVDRVQVAQAHSDLSGTKIAMRTGSGDIKAQSRLLGLHHVGPIAAAAHIALRLGLSIAEIEQGIAATKPFDHRLEPKEDGQGVVWLDDSYNGNPDGVRAVINFLSSLKCRRWYVTPGLVEMGSRREEVHRDIGRQLAEAGIEKVVLVRNSVTPYIAEGLQEVKFRGELRWYDSGLEALGALPQLTVQGDIVLLQNDWPDQYS